MWTFPRIFICTRTVTPRRRAVESVISVAYLSGESEFCDFRRRIAARNRQPRSEKKILFSARPKKRTRRDENETKPERRVAKTVSRGESEVKQKKKHKFLDYLYFRRFSLRSLRLFSVLALRRVRTRTTNQHFVCRCSFCALVKSKIKEKIKRMKGEKIIQKVILKLEFLRK